MNTNEIERAFAKLQPSKQNRFEDRISFLYLERRKITQDTFGVVAWGSDEDDDSLIKEKIQIPVGGLALLALGPGTSITHAALTSATRYGCVVMFTTGGAISANSVIAPLTSSSKWAIAQAKVVSNDTEARKVAKKFYSKQFGIDAFSGSITQMRAIEGSMMRKAYAREAKKYKVTNFHRDPTADDNVNVALNISNAILYGLGAAAVGALGMNQGLGVIHRGNASAFLFDIADFYKPSIVIPMAFSLAHEEPEEIPQLVRRKLRREIHQRDLLKDLVYTIQETFNEYLPKSDNDRLIGAKEEVAGHTNYSNSKGDKIAARIHLEGDEADVLSGEN